jgi:DNA-binding NarL/FixJ family response regulator
MSAAAPRLAGIRAGVLVSEGVALRLIIAEDSFLVREALTQLFAADPSIEVVGVAHDRGALVHAIDAQLPDVVVSDIRMPPEHESEGIDVAMWLRESHPEIGVVILSQFAEPEYALRLFEEGSGGRAYLLKERIGNRAEISAAIRAVAEGGSVVDPKIVDTLVAERARAERSPLARLSEREREVLAGVAAGRSNAAIAEELFLTKRAVEKHINAIFMKLNLRDTEDISRRVKATLMFLGDDGEGLRRTTEA